MSRGGGLPGGWALVAAPGVGSIAVVGANLQFSFTFCPTTVIIRGVLRHASGDVV